MRWTNRGEQPQLAFDASLSPRRDEVLRALEAAGFADVTEPPAAVELLWWIAINQFDSFEALNDAVCIASGAVNHFLHVLHEAGCVTLTSISVPGGYEWIASFHVTERGWDAMDVITSILGRRPPSPPAGGGSS